MMQAITTTAVPLTTAFWFGHSTFLSSPIDSWTKVTGAKPRRSPRPSLGRDRPRSYRRK